jgi:DNA-binding CsgD family transcriptional regulator
MPLDDAVFYERFTLRMGRVLTRLALHDAYDAIAADLNMDRRTVAADVAKAKLLTGCETQAELVHWWQTNRKPVAMRVLESFGIDPLELIA